MCDYSLHAVATRDAVAGETLVTTSFFQTTTRGLASPSDLRCAVCLKEGTELAFVEPVRFDNRWIWSKTLSQTTGKFIKMDTDEPARHHDAIEFFDGTRVLITQLTDGQEVRVVQLPAQRIAQPVAKKVVELRATRVAERDFAEPAE